ncbi:HAD family hydrolase [Parasphingorhabdus flavimaris]|mgnify:FL=1|jgi:2-haloacid dehalogenase|nr:HAD family phosphatase [Parasphingorhabdus flavimaris]|tara:strand:+ start:44237 stop:44866 length:630 start_codon:yes stop_codon:yes gene_type:complete
MMAETSAISKIDTVIFDIGNVLYRWDLRCLFAKLIDDPEELDWFLAHVVTPEWHFQHDAGRPFADMVAERSREFPEYSNHIRAYSRRFPESIPGPVEGMLDLVRALANRGVPLFAISNFGAESWAQFRPSAPIFDLFSDIVISGEEKLIKPDAAIYELALQRFSRRADQCLFIDDRPENIEAGEAVGIAGHHFTSATSLENELKALGLA